MRRFCLCKSRKRSFILACAFIIVLFFSIRLCVVTSNETNASAEEIAYTSSSGVNSQAYSSNNYTSGTKQQPEGGFIKADAFIAAMLISSVWFIVYIIKNRKHLRAKPVWDE